MKIIEVKNRTENLINELLIVWEDSVKATHTFLSDKEIITIKEYVPQALNDISHLIVIENENNMPIAFMGIENKKLEMLFVKNCERGKGLGKKLLKYGIENYNINELTVNEQNKSAKDFYEHFGFRTYKKTDIDEQGNPYPILYMKLEKTKNMKRKVILYISQSLDGFIADNKGSVDWILGNNEEYISDYGYDNFIKNIDTVILGANTYNQIKDELSPDKWVYEDLQSYILTNEKIKDTTNIKYVNMDIKELINKLQQEEGKDIWICGGASIVNQCVKENLIDEYQITTVPIILGSGIRLFEDNNKKVKLELKDTKEENGLIIGIYRKR